MAAELAARRLHLWSGLVVLGVFLAGAAAGAGLHAALRGGPFPGPPGPPPHAGRLPPPFGELGLTPEQQEKARAIGEKYRPAIEKVVAEGFPRLRAIQEDMERELRPALTEPQLRLLEELRARRPPPPRPGPGGLGPPPGGPPPGAPPDEPPPRPPPGPAR